MQHYIQYNVPQEESLNAHRVLTLLYSLLKNIWEAWMTTQGSYPTTKKADIKRYKIGFKVLWRMNTVTTQSAASSGVQQDSVS